MGKTRGIIFFFFFFEETNFPSSADLLRNILRKLLGSDNKMGSVKANSGQAPFGTHRRHGDVGYRVGKAQVRRWDYLMGRTAAFQNLQHPGTFIPNFILLPIEAESWTVGVFLGSSQLTYKDG
ncbi:hypothetical protein H112_04161 [Trichophyton rubrum D6]|uniref:Uncharacterized protein n=1 Tax=Trichophyton soudanense CBS 452.61 TaxID=1215331 RepID=A0A022XUY3_TRISD|nr:hypothetical protein H102_04154 [Trichophyton rubrum CBS 100081]EZF74081.1 hypothetical protein H105_04183 [Trichophyton soudanense CBS 452.61]KDB33897.1 hypothetical protein H112_04161 [Trichophyton rubrum D6]